MTTLILGMVHTLGKFFQTLKITLVRELLLEKKKKFALFRESVWGNFNFLFSNSQIIFSPVLLHCCPYGKEKKKRKEEKRMWPVKMFGYWYQSGDSWSSVFRTDARTTGGFLTRVSLYISISSLSSRISMFLSDYKLGV